MRDQPVKEPLTIFPSASPAAIHHRFECRATEDPHRPALSYDDTSLSYDELNRRANQLAHLLLQTGVTPQTPVALWLERSPNLVIAILAILKTGACYVPIDLAYPSDRVAFILQDTAAPVLLTESHLAERLPVRPAQVLCLDAQTRQLAQQPAHNPQARVTADHPAYIIYTSGSTGRPKGVIVTHHNVVRLLKSTEPWFHFGPDDVWVLFHSCAFDMSVWELWGALFYGGRLVIARYLVTRSPADFYQLLAREKVTFLNQTPSALRQLIWAESAAPNPPPLSLRFITLGGEALDLQMLKPWFDRHGDHSPTIVNMYGITETTVHTTYRPIRVSDLSQNLGSVIGVAIPDLQVHLLDDQLKPVPPGEPGEICVGGAGVARGYLNRPELTDQKFIPDPFSHFPGAKLYRSGDLARLNPAGEMEYLGRIDLQVKIRGFRIELGEIESALSRHRQVKAAVVVARDNPQGEKHLAAYVVPHNSPPSIADLRKHLAATLPDYMLPQAFVFLDAFPLNNNGKVDRRALPPPPPGRPALSTPLVPPSSDAELSLARICCSVLGLDQIGVQDNLFELGADSIRAILIVAKAREAGLNLTLETLFQHPTIKDTLSEVLSETFSKPPSETLSHIPSESASTHSTLNSQLSTLNYPISRLQLGMFYHNELDPASAVYHDVFSYRVDAPLDLPRLRTAIDHLVRRHPLLRTSFHLSGYSVPLQVVHPTAHPPITIEDLSRQNPQLQHQAALSWIDTEKRRPFDRSQPPLVRFHLQTLSPQSFLFFISFHHSCIDGWSLASLITELFQDYSALLRGAPPSTRAPATLYRDFIALEQQAIDSPVTREFWKTKLDGAQPQRLPRWPVTPNPNAREQIRSREYYIDPDVLEALKTLAQRAGVPLKTVLLAAHLRVLSTLHGQTEILTGLVTSGRPETLDADRVIGLFLNTVPLRQSLNGGSWLDLVRQTFQSERQLLPHRRFPLSEIQKLSGGVPLFETAFDYVHFHILGQLRHCGAVNLHEGPYFEANNLTTYTSFILDLSGSKLEVHIDYLPNAIAPEQIERMCGYYIRTLQTMAADPLAPYDQFSLLSPAEQRQLLVDWNDTVSDYPRQALHAIVEQRARENPHAPAVHCAGQTLSYAALDQRAGTLARRLAQVGVGPGAVVAICLPRCADILVALLGVLKTGAAYLPLDPDFPKPRLQYMLDDSQTQVLITHNPLAPLFPTPPKTLICLDQQENRPSEPLSEPLSETLSETSSGTLSESEPSSSTPPHSQPSSPIPRSAGFQPAYPDHTPIQVQSCPTGLSPSNSQLTTAYLIYTSGSTGNPKAVQIHHRSLVNLLTSAAHQIGFTATDHFLAVTTLSFDIAALELFLPLIVGGQVTVATRDDLGDSQRLKELLDSSPANYMQGTPTTWRFLLESGWNGKPGLTILVGGEALKRDLADALLARAETLWNFYGPTETTVWSTAWKVQHTGPITIGRPLANTQTYVLQPEQLTLLPVGTPGELFIGGDGLARGYLNQPELTAKKFIPNPFSTDLADRLYRTGDLVRLLPDSTIEWLGRIDQQVKIRGFRIEPGEIEAVLRQHTAIKDALVTAREDSLGDYRLVGYLLTRNGPPKINELRDFIRTKLPHYMVPSQFVLMREFPLTPNGKINLRLLPAPETNAEAPNPYVAPRDPIEHYVAQIWSEVLTLNQVGIQDDFFDLGGDSLSSTRAFARLNQAFGPVMTLSEFFEHPTIHQLATLIKQRNPNPTPNTTSIPRQPRL